MIQRNDVVFFLFTFLVIVCVDCGVFSRNFNNNNMGQYSPSSSGIGSMARTKNFGSAGQQQQEQSTQKPAYNGRSGISAWGIITLILLVILLGMGGYYGIICYPLICRENSRSYNIMDTESTSSGTPTRTTSDFDKFEKIDYSSRSTTPSKSHESHD